MVFNQLLITSLRARLKWKPSASLTSRFSKQKEITVVRCLTLSVKMFQLFMAVRITCLHLVKVIPYTRVIIVLVNFFRFRIIFVIFTTFLK